MGELWAVFCEDFEENWLYNGNNCIAYRGLILGLHPTNEGRPYKLAPSLIGWAQT